MESDERLRWIELHVTTSLKPKVDDLKLLFGSEKSRATLLEFLTNEDKKIVYVFYHNGVLNANQDAPLKVDGKFIVFFKIQSAVKITRENINHQLYYMEWSEDFLQHFEDVTRNVFLPILSVEQPGGLSCDRLMDLLHKILSSSTIMSGKLQSMVNLPIPNIEVLSSAGHFHHRQQAVTHILETTLIGWIKQIKNALNDKPNTPMGSKANHFPMPKTEVQFWHKHLSTIQFINEQLCSPQIVSVLTTLEDRNSTYAHSFHNIKRDLAKAEHETMTIVRFLGTLEPYFTLIENGYKLHELIQVFSPMMHTLLLMWTYSKYYHGPDQINRLLQMIANLVVFKAREIVGEAFIDDPESQGFLRQSLKICAAFRGTYLDTKDKADEINTFKVEEQAELNEEQVGVTWHSSVYKNARTQRGAGLFNKTRNEHEYEENFWEDSPWPARNSPVFDVLNKYMERCNDVLELVEVSQQFKKIKFASNLDGAGEPSLNSQIVDIVNDFDDALAQFNCSVKNVLDLDKGLPFESAFFNFHSKVRDLESQFGMLVAGSLKEGWDIKAKLRLLDVFEGITTRDLIQTVLHDILSTFIEHVEKELQSTKQLFDQKMNKKTSHQHLSPVTNQILWLRSLSGRIEELYYKMTKVAPMCFDGERGWRAKDLYKDLCRKIKFTEEQTLAAWLKNFDHEVMENLNQPLLRLDDGLFHVNFDEKLKIVLREIRDMTSHDIPMKLPHDVTQKIENIDILKLQAVNTRLSAATSQFNIMEQNLLDIERNLVNHNIDRARKILTEGVTTYTWNDVHMDDFIQEAIHVVYTDNIKIVDTIKENYERICQIVNSWAESTFQYTMMDESHWPFTFEDYDARQKSIMEDIQRKMKTGCKKIVQHLQAIYEVVKISRTTPQWVAYKEFVNSKVINGLRDSILISLRYIYNSLVAKELQAGSGNTQFLQVDVSLVGSIVYFKPPVDGSLAEVSMIEYFDSWLSAILTRTDSLKELDLVKELKSCIMEDQDIQHLCEQTKAIVADTASECKKLTALFSDYAFLWTQDINTVFKEFLAGNLRCRPQASDANDGESIEMADGRDTRASMQSRSSSVKFITKDISMTGSRKSHSANTTSSGVTSGITRLRDKRFLKSAQNKGKEQPNIDDFDHEISVFKEAKEEVGRADIAHSIGWVRINMQPIKETIETYASKWLYTYTKYLSDQVHLMLNSLDSFLKRTEPGIEAITGEESDVASFMKLMRIFNEVNRQQSELDNNFIKMKDMLEVLDKYNQKLPAKTQAFYEAAPVRWNNLKMKVSQAKKKLGPRIQAKHKDVAEVLSQFKTQCQELRYEIEDSNVYSRSIEMSMAYTLIDQFGKEVELLEAESHDLVELQELLEKEIFDFNLIKTLKNELALLQQIWDINKVIKDQQTEWKRHRWQRIKTKLLKRGLDAQYDLVMKLSDRVHSWDVTLCLEETINEFMSCIPIMEDLGKAALRSRHWKQLARSMGTSVIMTTEVLNRMTLDEFLKLGLQNHSDEVRSIVKRSSKDVHIENMLKLYEEIWLSKVFETKRHSRLIANSNGGYVGNEAGSVSGSEYGPAESEFGYNTSTGQNSALPPHASPSQAKRTRSRMMSVTSIAHSSLAMSTMDEDPDRYLLDNPDAILHELRAHQVSLQEVLGHSSATAFLDEISKWQKTLQNIETFILHLNDAQEIWIQLDEVYNSVDIRLTMGKESAIFANASKEFIGIMKNINKNPNILQISSAPGIIYKLEKIHLTLVKSSVALSKHTDKRRNKNPHFFMLSREETYSLLCKGYDPNLLTGDLNKLFGNVKSLHTIDNTQTYQIVAFESHDGEIVKLAKPITCENGIENWLPNLQRCISQTIQNELTRISGLKEIRPENDETPPVTPIKKSSPDTSVIFTYLLKTLLPLPATWSIDANTDAVMLSIKLMTSALLSKYLEAYANGKSDALDIIMSGFNQSIIALSEFLFAQGKIKIRKKNLARNQSHRLSIDEAGRLNISASLEQTPTPYHFQIKDKRIDDGKDYQLENYQTKLIKNFIQYFSNQVRFVENLKETIELGYNLKKRYPFDWYIHPRYVLAESRNMASVQVEIGQHSIPYVYQYQGVGKFVSVPLEHETGLHRLACTVMDNDFGHVLPTQDTSCTNIASSLGGLTGRHLLVYPLCRQTPVHYLTDLLKGACMTGAWICFNKMEVLPESFFSVLTKSLADIHHALQSKQTTVVIGNDDVTLSKEIAIFTISNSSEYKPLPTELAKMFKTVSYGAPDTQKLIEVGLIKAGMLMARNLVPKIHSFLSLIQETIPVFQSSFSERRICSLTKCMHHNFKDILKWKDNQLLAKELSTIEEQNEVEHNELEEGEEIMFDQAIEDLGKLADDDDSEHSYQGVEHEEGEQYTEEEMTQLSQTLQNKAVILALHQMFSPAVISTNNEMDIFERMLCETFSDVDVMALLEESLQNQESRAAGVKLDLKDDQAATSDEKEKESIYRAINTVSHFDGFDESLTTKLNQMAEIERSSKLIGVVGKNQHLSWQCIQGFLKSYQKFKKNTQVYVVSPAACTRQQIFGYFENNSSIWHDGSLIRAINKNNVDRPHFIIIDGKINEELASYFTEILSAKGFTTLDNGNRLVIPHNIRFILQLEQVEDIPSNIISNVPVVSTDGLYPSWKIFLKIWATTKLQLTRDHIVELCSQYIEATLDHMTHKFECLTAEERACKEYQLVYNMLNIFDGLSGHVTISSDCDNYMNFAAFWTFFGLLQPNERHEFSKWWTEKWSSEIYLPEESEMWNFIVNPETHIFQSVYDFMNTEESCNFVQEGIYLSISYLVTALIDNGTSIILSGAYGSGKASLFRDEYLHNKPEGTDISVLLIQANEFLTCESLWERLNQVLEWKHSDYYEPIGNKKLVCFIKDLHNLQHHPEPVLYLLQQLIKHNSAYNPYRKQTQSLGEITFVLTTTQENDYLRDMVNFIPVIKFPEVCVDDQERIFNTILSFHFMSSQDRSFMDLMAVKTPNVEDYAHMKRMENVTAMKKLLNKIVSITIELQNVMKTMYLRTPQRFHYVFTMRTLKRLFTQLCRSLPSDAAPRDILTTWYYELHWTYHYVLIDDVDKERWRHTFKTIAKKELAKEQMEILEDEVPILSNIVVDKETQTVVRWENQESPMNNKFSIQQLQTFLKNHLMEFNKDNPKLKIYFFEDRVRIMYRLLQILQSNFSNGHALLIIEGSPDIPPMLFRLLSDILQIELFTVNPSSVANDRVYDMEMFKSDLVSCLIKAGIKKQKVIFTLTSLELFDDGIITLVDELLQKGTMAHVFNEEDKNSVINTIRTSGDQEQARLSKAEAWNEFVKNIHENLHVLLSLSFTDEKFQEISLRHPNLITAMQVVYSKIWDQQKLVQVAQYVLSELTDLKESKKQDIAYLLAALHIELQKQDGGEVAGRHNNITNANFELFIERFVDFYTAKTKEIEEQKETIRNTLRTVEESSSTGLSLVKKLDHEKRVITQKQQGCTTLLTQIGQDRAITEEHTRLVKKTKSKRDKLKKLIPQYEEAHKRAIFKAAAIVRETKSILQSLDDRELSDIRSMQKPDTEIEDLLAAIIIVVKSPSADLTWNRGAKRIMANIERFKEDLSGFDDVELPDATLQVLRPYVNKPHFAPGYLSTRTGNTAIGSLVLYVRGVVRYNYIMQSHVKPLHQKVSDTAEKLDMVSEKLSGMEKKLKDLKVRLCALGENFEDACVERSQQKESVDHLNQLLDKETEFDKLLSSLTEDWKDTLESLDQYTTNICSEVLLASAFSVYMGPYDEGFRSKMLTEYWYQCLVNQGMPVDLGQRDNIIIGSKKDRAKGDTTAESRTDTPPQLSYHDMFYQVAQSLVSEDTLRKWLTQGFNWDVIQNLVLLNTPLKRAVYCMDPEHRLDGCLQEIRLENQEIIELDYAQRDSNFINILERAISNGAMVTIKNIDNEIDPIFHSLIYLLMTSSSNEVGNGKQIIKFNGHRLQYNQNFRLIMINRLYNFNIPKEFYSLCTVIDLRPTQHLLCSDVQQVSLDLMSPNVLDYWRHILYSGLTIIRQLDSINGNLMNEIQKCQGSHEMWNNTEKLQNLALKRKELNTQLTIIQTEYKECKKLMADNDYFSKILAQLFLLQRSICRLGSYYQFNYGDFITTLKNIIQDKGFKTQTDVKDDETPDTDLVYDANAAHLLSSEIVFTKRSFDMLKEENAEVVLKEFEKRFFMKLKRTTSRDHYEVIRLVYMLMLKNEEENDIVNENFIEILLSFKDLYNQSQRDFSTHVTPFNRPDWLAPFQYNMLQHFAEKFPPFKSFVEDLSTSSGAIKEWSETTRPEETPLPLNSSSALRVLAIMALRPDRLSFALKKWTREIMDDFTFPGLMECLASFDSAKPLLIVKSREMECAQYMDHLQAYAEKEKLKPHYICMSQADRDAIDASLTSAIQHDLFLVIDNIHLTNQDHLSSLYNRLFRLRQQSIDGVRWRVALVTNDTRNINEPLLRLCTTVNWDSITFDEKQTNLCDELSWTKCLHFNITKALKRIPARVWKILQEGSSLDLRTLVYTLCVLDGYVTSLYADCASKRSLVPLASDGFLKVVDYVIGEFEKGKTDNFLYHEIVYLLSEEIYSFQNEPNPIRELALDIVCRPAANHAIKSLSIGSIQIPIPPINVPPRDFATWLDKYFTKWLQENSPIELEVCQTKWLRFIHTETSKRFCEDLSSVYTNLNNNTAILPSRIIQPLKINVQSLYENLLQCKENVPEQIILKEPLTGSKDMLKMFWKKECKHFNEKILQINEMISVVEKNIAGGERVLPQKYHGDVIALSSGYAPSSVLPNNRNQNMNDLKKWLNDMRTTAGHLKDLYTNTHHYLVFGNESRTKPLKLSSVGNIRHFFTILRFQKAVKENCTIEKIRLNCCFQGDPVAKETKEPMIVCDDLYTQGMTVVPNSSIKFVEPTEGKNIETIEKLPPLFIWADFKSNFNEKINCNVYFDEERLTSLFKLPFNTKRPMTDFVYSRPAVLLTNPCQ